MFPECQRGGDQGSQQPADGPKAEALFAEAHDGNTAGESDWGMSRGCLLRPESLPL